MRLRAIALSMCLMLQAAAMAAAKRVNMEAEGTALNAAAGETGTGVQESAVIVVHVTDAKGNGLSALGANVGNGTTAIALPAGWSLDTVALAVGGASVTPTQFLNLGGGSYFIRVASVATTWVSGDYIVRAAFQNASFRGSTLAEITIE